MNSVDPDLVGKMKVRDKKTESFVLELFGGVKENPEPDVFLFLSDRLENVSPAFCDEFMEILMLCLAGPCPCCAFAPVNLIF